MSCCSVQQASGRSRSTVYPGAATSSSLRAHCAVAADRHAGRRLADAGHELVDAIRAVELHRDSVETTAATLRARRPSSAPVSGHPVGGTRFRETSISPRNNQRIPPSGPWAHWNPRDEACAGSAPLKQSALRGLREA